MPVYQYACTDCGQDLEVRQSFTDDALTVCPACDGRLRKVLSAVGVVFKGSGFYRTDSRNGAGKSEDAANADGKATSESSGGSESSGAAEKSRDSRKSGTGEKAADARKSSTADKPTAPPTRQQRPGFVGVSAPS